MLPEHTELPTGWDADSIDGRPPRVVVNDGPGASWVLIVALLGFFAVMVACVIAGRHENQATTINPAPPTAASPSTPGRN